MPDTVSALYFLEDAKGAAVTSLRGIVRFGAQVGRIRAPNDGHFDREK